MFVTLLHFFYIVFAMAIANSINSYTYHDRQYRDLVYLKKRCNSVTPSLARSL